MAGNSDNAAAADKKAAGGGVKLQGVMGALGMLLKKKWAATMFLLSLIALLVQMIGAYVATPAWSAYGPVGLVMPAVLLAIALFLLWYANKAQARGWLS